MIRLYKHILIAGFYFISQLAFAQPANDNCASATALTPGAALLCGQTTNGATTQAGEHCAASGGGITPKTVWYSFVATSTSMVVNVLRTNDINCYGYLSVYGPNPTCMPGAGAAILSCVLMNGDPGYYPQLTGLTVGATYYINYNGQGCGGGNDAFHVFCIGVYNTANNNTVNSPSLITACGVTFNGSTQGGYSPSGTGTGFRNLDNNNATTCPACGAQPGADVSFVINNDSWFSFCTVNAGTWQIAFNVGTCVFSGVNSGAQMALFTGTPSALTWHSQAANPTYSGGSWTSPTITLAAGECAYMMVDGFAGDACAYSYTLTNLTGGCIVLPIELISFNAHKKGDEIKADWVTATESNNSYFTLEKSKDGIVWETVGVVVSQAVNGNSTQVLNYSKVDTKPYSGTSYYRLKQTDYDGKTTTSAIQAIQFEEDANLDFDIVPNPASQDGFVLNFNHPSDSNYTLEIVDLTGKLVYSKPVQITDTKLEINETLSKGMYFLQLKNADNSFTKKLIIK